jgi:hypothetical protein
MQYNITKEMIMPYLIKVAREQVARIMLAEAVKVMLTEKE